MRRILSVAGGLGTVACVLVGVSGVWTGPAFSQGSTSNCSAQPAPSDCVTSIKFIDPTSFTVVPAPNGVTIQWNPTGPGSVEQLPAPEPAAVAAKQAAAEAPQHGLMTSRPGQPPSPPPANTRNRRSLRQYSGYCSVYAYTPNIVGVGGDQYHMHAQSEQYCTTAASTGSVITYLERDSTYMAGDSDTNFGGQVENTDAWTTCHYAGVHTWWNYSDFTAQVNGQLVQGPAGFFTYADHRCY